MLDSATRNTFGVARGATGTHTGDGTKLKVTLGYRPKHIVMANITDVVRWEKIDGMAANAALKTVTAGTLTVDTTSALVILDDGFEVTAAVNINAKAFAWFAA